jgi:hypothetical protein
MKRADVIEAGQHAGAAIGNVGREGREIRPHVGHEIDVQAEKAAILGQGHARRGDVVAALGIADEMIGPVRHPFDRTPQFARSERGERVLAIGKQLGAETAADVGADDPHLLLRNLQHHVAQDFAQPMTALAAYGQRQAIRGNVVIGDDRSRFHEIGDDARIDDRDLGHRMRARKRLLGRSLVADLGIEQQVAGVIRPDLRRVLAERRDGADRGRQRLPVHLDRLDRIPRPFDGFGNDERHGVTDMADLVTREDRIRRRGEGVVREIEQARQPAQFGRVVGREDRRHAGQVPRRGHIDGEPRMGVRRAQHQCVQRLLRQEIGRVMPFAANQRVVFLAANTVTDAELEGS